MKRSAGNLPAIGRAPRGPVAAEGGDAKSSTEPLLRRREMKLHPMVVKTTLKALLLLAIFAKIATSTAQGQMQVYGLWHCYTDACSWASVTDMTYFDRNNLSITDRRVGYSTH